MTTATAIAMTVAMGLGAFAQELQTGFYVAESESCEGAPAVAMLSFDGKSFINGNVYCYPVSGLHDGQLTVSCLEGNDPASKEDKTWSYKLISNSMFEIDDQIYRQCGRTP